MILGERKDIPPNIYRAMIKSGTVHILVVSGFNVGIVYFTALLFLKVLRLKRRMIICLSMPLLVFYCLLTGGSNPVLRATVMAIVFLPAYLVKREPDIYNSCAIAGLFILIRQPRQLFDIGFQLSFASVISIVCLYPKMKLFFRSDNLKIRWLRYLVNSTLVCFSAWLGTMGLVAYYFRIFSPLTVLANLLVVPLATLITLSGFSLLATGCLCPPLATLLARSSEFLVILLVKIQTLLLKIPYAYFYLS
jgi:competence protein ComEC